MTPSNRELAERAAQGDREALAALLEEHLPHLRAFVHRRAGPAVRAREAESDIVQSACREVLAHADDFRIAEDEGFRRWLYVTALRKILDKDKHYRAAKRDVGRDASAVADEQDVAEPRFDSPSEEAIGREELARIEEAMSKLSPDEREVILLSRLMGHTRAEVAERMGRTEQAIGNLLYRALAKVARALEVRE